MTTTTVRVAAIQAAPVLLDTEATIDHVDKLTAKAAADGAQLVLFPETFVPGYPDWMWRTRPWHDGDWYQRLAGQAVQVPGPATERLGEIAATHASTWPSASTNDPTATPRCTTRCSTSPTTASSSAVTASSCPPVASG